MSNTKVPLIDLRRNQCRWPEGGTNTKILFCGEEVVDKDCPYCIKHKKESLSKKMSQKTKMLADYKNISKFFN